MWTNLCERLRALHRDEGGADMVEYILLIAIIALPLLAILLIFKDKIKQWVNDYWDSVTQQANNAA